MYNILVVHNRTVKFIPAAKSTASTGQPTSLKFAPLQETEGAFPILQRTENLFSPSCRGIKRPHDKPNLYNSAELLDTITAKFFGAVQCIICTLEGVLDTVILIIIKHGHTAADCAVDSHPITVYRLAFCN